MGLPIARSKWTNQRIGNFCYLKHLFSFLLLHSKPHIKAQWCIPLWICQMLAPNSTFLLGISWVVPTTRLTLGFSYSRIIYSSLGPEGCKVASLTLMPQLGKDGILRANRTSLFHVVSTTGWLNCFTWWLRAPRKQKWKVLRILRLSLEPVWYYSHLFYWS